MWSGAERGNPFFPRAHNRTVCIAHKSPAAASTSSMVARSVRSRSCHDKWPFTASLSLFPSFLSAPSPFPLLSLRTAGNEAISRARFRLCENFRSHFLIISPSSSTPLPHLAEKMALDGPCPLSLSLLFRVSTLPSANLVLKFRRESKRPAFSCPLNKAACLGESRHPLSAVTLSPYPPLISSVLARSLVVIRAY